MIYFCYSFIFFIKIVLCPLVMANFYTTDELVPFPKSFVGSNLFGDGKFVKKCFSMEDVALLSARSRFEALIPNFTITSTDLENDKSVEQMLEYLQEINGLMSAVSGNIVQYITQAAYYDAIGGYLHFFYLPFVKFSFYAGTLTYKNTLKVYNIQNNCKRILNTHGNGWRMSTFKFLKMKFKIQPINIHTKGLQSETSDEFKDPCGNLLLASDDDYSSDYADRELIVSLPRIETVDNDNIVSVWLPFKNQRNFILNSKSSAFVLTRYYVDVLKCYQFRNVMSNPFNRRFQKLLHEKVLPLIHNEEFYPGFGAILRVMETLKDSSVVVRGTYKYDIDGDEFWDESVSLFDGSDPNFRIKNEVSQSDEARAVNETNFFLKMVDSVKNYEMEWNQKEKIKYICLAFAITFIGLLLIILCILVSRERRKTIANRSTLTRERENNWKMLLRKLSRTPAKNGVGIETNSEPDLKYTKYEDTTSLASDTVSTKPTPTYLKTSSSQIKSTDRRNISNARHKKMKYKTLCNDDNFSGSSSSSTSNSTKTNKRRIYRKIRDEMKQSRYGDHVLGRAHSMRSKLEFVPTQLKKSYNFKFKKKANGFSPTEASQSSDSERERNSSGWETLPSLKVSRNVKN